MERESEIYLPPLRWQRPTSSFRYLWVVFDERCTVAIVHEGGGVLGTWIFFSLEEYTWVELIEFGSHGIPFASVHSRFGEIVECAAALDRSYACFLVIERREENIWWLLYYRLRVGEVLFLCAFRARFSDMMHELMETSSEEGSTVSDSSEFLPGVFDI
jgi:hypothetical protein